MKGHNQIFENNFSKKQRRFRTSIKRYPTSGVPNLTKGPQLMLLVGICNINLSQKFQQCERAFNNER